MIHASATAESIVAPTLFRPEFSHSLGHEVTRWRATSSCALRRPSLRPERLHGSFVGEDADDVLPWVGRPVLAAVLADEFGDGLAALVGGGAVTRHLHSEFYSVDHLG